MFDGLLYYIANTYPGLSRVYGSLDVMIRKMAISQSLGRMTGDIERLLPGVEKFLQEQDRVSLSVAFTMPTVPEGRLMFLEYE